MTVDRATPAEGARLRRPRWRDPRLLVGLVLVLASVAGVVALLTAAQRTQTYWAAARDLAPGSPVDAAAFVPAEAQLGDAAGLYLSTDRPAPAGQVVGAVVRRGEFVPAGVMAPVDPARRRPVGVALAEPLPTGVGVGDRVDVWAAAPKKDGRGHQPPERLAAGVEIAERSEEAGGLGGTATTRLQLMADEELLPRLLDAKTSDARITVVPALGEG